MISRLQLGFLVFPRSFRAVWSRERVVLVDLSNTNKLFRYVTAYEVSLFEKLNIFAFPFLLTPPPLPGGKTFQSVYECVYVYTVHYNWSFSREKYCIARE